MASFRPSWYHGFVPCPGAGLQATSLRTAPGSAGIRLKFLKICSKRSAMHWRLKTKRSLKKMLRNPASDTNYRTEEWCFRSAVGRVS